MHPDEETFEPAGFYITDIRKVGKIRGIKPKFHVSEQGSVVDVVIISDYIEVIPDYFLEIPEKY